MKQERANPYSLRIAEELKIWLQEMARKAKRSLNAEIEIRLEESRENETGK